MASFTAGTTFVDGVANDVTAAKLGTLVTNATPTSGLIQDRTAETVVATNDTLLIGDASDSNTLKRMTVANVMKAEHTGTINTTAGTIQTLTSSTATITTGTIATLNSTTGTIAGLSSTNGTIANLNSTTGTVATLNSTTGTITTGVIPTLTSITKITSGTGTAAAPAISPTGDTNTGIFFPLADTTAFSGGGAEAMRIDANGQVGIGIASPSGRLEVSSGTISGQTGAQCVFPLRVTVGYGGSGYGTIGYNLDYRNATSNSTGVKYLAGDTISQLDFAGGGFIFRNATSGTAGGAATLTERLRIDSSGNVGIGTASPSAKLHIVKTVSQTDIDGADQIAYLANTSTDASGNLSGIRFRQENGTNVAGGFIGLSSTGSVATRANLIIATPNTSGNSTERLRIDSSGNVGVGTDSPGARLSVDSSTISRYAVFNSTSTNGGYLEFRSIGTVQGDIGTASQVVSGSTSDFAVNARGARNLVLGTNNTERLRIDSSGNVSIGTATALSKLHVHGDLTMSNATTAVTASTSTITPPATVAGYLTVSINGTSRKIAYYAT